MRLSSRRAPAGAFGSFVLCAKAGQTRLSPEVGSTSLLHPADLDRFGACTPRTWTGSGPARTAVLPKIPLRSHQEAVTHLQ